MNKFGVIALTMLLANLAHAELYETRLADGSIAFSDRAVDLASAKRHARAVTHAMQADALPGTWHARSPNGHATELTLRADGSFVLDQRNDSSLHRLYMCGTWQASERALDLEIKAHKQRFDSGDTEQNAGSYHEQARILSARRDRMTLIIDGQQLTFDRG